MIIERPSDAPTTRAYHTFVRLVPDVVRGEFLNVGVIDVFPDSGHVHHAFGASELFLARAAAFDPEFDAGELNGLRFWLDRDAQRGEIRILCDDGPDVFQMIPVASESYLNEMARRKRMNRHQLGYIGCTEFYVESITEEDEKQHLADLLARYVEPPTTEVQ